MKQIKILLPNKTEIEVDAGSTPIEIASKISVSLAKKCVYAIVNGVDYDLNRKIESDSTLTLVTDSDPSSLDVLRHSAAHLLALAVKRLYKNAKFGTGPSIEEGFYYDIDFDTPISSDDLKAIEDEMRKVVKEELKITRSEISYNEALALFKDDPYKSDLINTHKNETLTIYRQGDFVDLCRGPHVTNTKDIKYFKLLSIAGAYFKADSNNKMLTRVYGTAFFKKEELEQYLINLEERKKRDHRKLGKELELFMLSDFGPGFPFWLPNGMALRKALIDYWYEEHIKRDYKLIDTPIMLNRELWEVSGHWFNYKDNMYTSEIDKHEFAIKPMNCPGAILVYKNDLHSYREFPIKIGELGHVHRHEASGALSGLFRVRAFTQDDAHIFITKEQIIDEVDKLILFYKEIYEKFNLPFKIELSTMPDNHIGEEPTWREAEKALGQAISKAGFEYTINEGDGAFYGPKVDFKLKDSMNRIWQCGTIQLDMNLPVRFDLSYVEKDGSKQTPIMLHRALLGSIERFIGILIEHYGGAFPTWLSPIQVAIIPVNSSIHLEYSKKLSEELTLKGVRCEVFSKDEKLGFRVREASIKKIPYQIIIGDNELNGSTLNVREHKTNENKNYEKEDFIKYLVDEIQTRK